MSWFYLIVASIFEIGWPTGLKMIELSSHKILWGIFAAIAMLLSGVFLYLAQKEIPIGNAYAIWTGIGACFTFLIGIVFFQDAFSLLRGLGIGLIIVGIILLECGH